MNHNFWNLTELISAFETRVYKYVIRISKIDHHFEAPGTG